jgi:hypothetical protein
MLAIYSMNLSRILVGLAVLGVCAAVLALIFNLLKALLIVGGIALALGLVLGLRGFGRRRPAVSPAPARSERRRKN